MRVSVNGVKFNRANPEVGFSILLRTERAMRIVVRANRVVRCGESGQSADSGGGRFDGGREGRAGL